MAATEYDVLIIGSGASGGMAAYTLAQKGVKCLLLDAGPQVDFQRNRGFKAVYELPYRGFGDPDGFRMSFRRTNSRPINGWTRRRSRIPTIRKSPITGFAFECSAANPILGAHVVPVERL